MKHFTSQYTVETLKQFCGKYVMIQLVEDMFMPQPSPDGQRIDLMESPDPRGVAAFFAPYMKENGGEAPPAEAIIKAVNDGLVPLVPAMSRPVIFGELEETKGTLVIAFQIDSHGPHTYKMTLCPSDIKHISWLEPKSLIQSP